jgi:glycosyltransferase involved in cell wall biosynthesis
VRIALCTAQGRVDDILTWSGVPANVVRTMQSLDIDHVVLGELSPHLVQAAMFVAAASKRARMKVNWEVEPRLNRRMTRQAQEQAKTSRADVLLALGWRPIGLADSDLPTVLWTDATFAQRVEKAPHWRYLSRRTRRLVTPIERQSLHEMAAVIMTSSYARDDAIARYDLDPARIHRIGFGASVEALSASPKPRAGSPPRLLAVGVKWHRKGLDRCVHIADELHDRGIPVRLDIAGCPPPNGSWRRDYVTYHGFLDKRNEVQRKRLEHLYAAADLFVLPTRNEPFGIVFAEAAANALPALGSDIDGVSDVVADGSSGVLLPVDAPVTRYADEAAKLIESADAYAKVSRGALEHYHSSLTWAHAVCGVVRVCETAAKA